MSKFKFDESLMREFKSSTKESLSDIGANDEEIDKIQFELSQSSRKIQLRTDYSDFKNHIFFGSAYAATNFALARLYEYPSYGELKEKNEWKRTNGGFENYFFDQHPKQQGYAYFSSSAYVKVDDPEYKLRPGTGSISFECVLKPYDNIQTIPGRKTVFSFYDAEDDVNGSSAGLAIYFSSSQDKRIYFELKSQGDSFIFSSSYASYISSSHHISFVYDAPAQKQIFYIDGIQIASASVGPISSISPSTRTAYIGAMSASIFGGFGSYFTGCIDDARLWLSQEPRKPELIKRNYYRTVHADHSGGLKLYYKFNETGDFLDPTGKNVADYSGLGIHGKFTGSYSFSTNIVSGTLGSWFKDDGELIFNETNSRVSSSLATYRVSASFYDDNNRNIIFNLVPSYFIENKEHEEMQRFLLLVAKNYDQLKLYVDNIVNTKNTEQADFGNTPDDLLNMVAENFGVDLGGVYEGASALESIFGENVLPSGSLDSSVNAIRSQIKRNLLSNLIYIIKTKSTRQAVEGSLRAMGLDEDIVNINEYASFSGGIETGRTSRDVERKVVKFPVSGTVMLSSSVFRGTEPSTYEFRALFNTGSTFLTSSLFNLSGGIERLDLRVERQSLTSSNAVLKLRRTVSGATITISSSVLPLFDNNWINIAAIRNYGSQKIGLYVGKLDRDEISISESISSSTIALTNLTGTIPPEENYLGSKRFFFGSNNLFDGHIQEFRHWSLELSKSILINHTKDFESLEVPNFATDISALKTHLKLNDYTGSFNNESEAHDYVHGFSGSYYKENVYPFQLVGKYITKLEPSYSYDFAINNDKVRTRNSAIFTDEDVVEDIPYLSVDMSPVASLNKEIVRWFGGLEKFNNLIGQPYNRYRESDEITSLNQYKHEFFNRRVNNKISFKNYLNLLKWFDSNFTYFLNQIIPLDVASSLSSFVIEPHVFEYNKVTYPFTNKKINRPIELLGAASALMNATSELTAPDLALADPGRFGSPVSASAGAFNDVSFNYSSSINFSGNVLGLNFKNKESRNRLDETLKNNSLNHALSGFGNGFYSTTISCSNYMKNVLNVNEKFYISGANYPGGGSAGSNYLTSAFRPINTHYTGAINGVTDQRWQWLGNPHASRLGALPEFNGLTGATVNVGIGYGGGWGQLYSINNKSLRVADVYSLFPYGEGISALAEGASFDGLGGNTNSSQKISTEVTIEEGTEESPTYILWPTLRSYDPVKINFPDGVFTGSRSGSIVFDDAKTRTRLADFDGERVLIDGFKTLSVNIFAKRLTKASPFSPSLGGPRFFIKFRFHDSELAGAGKYETAFSSSSPSATSYSTTTKENVLVFEETALTSDENHEFVLSFERELPKAKYMTMRVSMVVNDSDSVPCSYKMQFKGTLHKQSSESNEKLLKFEGK